MLKFLLLFSSLFVNCSDAVVAFTASPSVPVALAVAGVAVVAVIAVVVVVAVVVVAVVAVVVVAVAAVAVAAVAVAAVAVAAPLALDEKPMVSFCFVFWWPYRFCKQATANFLANSKFNLTFWYI